MSVEIIYEKKYPRIDPMEEMKQIELEMADEPKVPTPSFDEVMAKIQANTGEHHLCPYAGADQSQ